MEEGSAFEDWQSLKGLVRFVVVGGLTVYYRDFDVGFVAGMIFTPKWFGLFLSHLSSCHFSFAISWRIAVGYTLKKAFTFSSLFWETGFCRFSGTSLDLS